MSALVFLDTETTGLSLDDDIWEFGAIRREPDGTEREVHLFLTHDPDKCNRLPESFRKDHIARYDSTRAVTPNGAAHQIKRLLTGRPHIVGAVPNFDTERLARLLSRFWYGPPSWHHHLIDVEALAVGYLAAQGWRPKLPWDSDLLSRACGVEPPTTERHTAMGDARWARDLYDAITARERVA